MLAGTAAWIVYFNADLVLSHYDAKAHLVVARRVIDSLTPGWQQVGAVWLPLPHLLQLIPVQVDLFYRTGAAGSFTSIACFGITVYAVARLVIAATGSRLGAVTSTAILALNPNLLYLQSTPMTEPLLLATTALLVLWLFEWVRADTDVVPARVGLALFAAAWTRYEAWAVSGAALAAVVFALWRQGVPFNALIRRACRLAVWPAAAVVIFLVNSRITIGSWFVSDGFYVADPLYQAQAVRTLMAVWWGTHRLSGFVVETVALIAAAACVVRATRTAADARLLIPVALFAAAALPLYGFYEGHPYRIRYMVPLVFACAVFGGLAVGLTRRAAGLVGRKAHDLPSVSRTQGDPWMAKADARAGRAWGPRAGAALATLLMASVLVESPPWDRNAAMLVEAQWDRPFSVARRTVSACLARGYRGDKILASMGSLAHYMQELSWDGFRIADFVHEGNGAIWRAAMESGPAPHAGWMLVEERAEGGDILAARLRRDPAFARQMTRVCEGGGVALYKRDEVKGQASKVK